MEPIDLKEISGLIKDIENAARNLMEKAQGIQAIERNADRILASAKMLEINVVDICE